MSNGSALSLYADRKEVAALATRLAKAAPGGNRLADNQALALAQIALAHDLDPWNGEVWFIPGSGVMVGIKGLRKAADRECQRDNNTYWLDFQRVEAKKYGLDEKGTVIYECHLRDVVTTQAYAKSVNSLTSGAEVPYSDAVKMLGPAPVSIGVGIATEDEKSKMRIHARARKRAEADAIKMRFGVEFAGATFSEEGPGDVIDGQWADADSDDPWESFEAPANEPKKSEAQLKAELGFDGPPEPEESLGSEDAQPPLDI